MYAISYAMFLHLVTDGINFTDLIFAMQTSKCCILFVRTEMDEEGFIEIEGKGTFW